MGIIFTKYWKFQKSLYRLNIGTDFEFALFFVLFSYTGNMCVKFSVKTFFNSVLGQGNVIPHLCVNVNHRLKCTIGLMIFVLNKVVFNIQLNISLRNSTCMLNR